MIIKTGTIYKATSQTSGKSYIGQTQRPAFDLHKRIKEHFNTARNIKKKAHFQNAILKYGYEDFEWSVLEEPLLENLNKQEVLWISTFDTYKNGYNSFPGGEYINSNGIQKTFAFRETRCCRTCGTVFSVKIKDLKDSRKSGKYCCHECFLNWQKKHNKKLTKICPICEKEFDTYQNQKCCSVECAAKNGKYGGEHNKIRRIDRECEWCDNIFSVPVSANGTSEATLRKLNKTYCSEKCWLEVLEEKRIKKNCLNCNKEFETIPSKEKTFCSFECYLKSVRITFKCEGCGEEFETQQSNPKKYCSAECYKKMKRTITECKICGKEFEHLKSRERICCSNECAYEYLKKDKVEHIKKICPVCQVEFDHPPCQYYVKCCSRKCSNKLGFKTDIKNRKKIEKKNYKKYKNYEYHLIIYKHTPNYYMFIRDENFIQIARKSTGKKIYKEAEKVLFDFIDNLKKILHIN